MIKKIKDHWIDNSSKKDSLSKLNSEVFFIGAPDDRGVSNVGGRLGAGLGPLAIRDMLSQFMLGFSDSLESISIYKGVDIDIGNTIEDGHRTLRHAVHSKLVSSTIPIILGGGHDYGYPHVAGAYDAFGEKVALINVDAHLDVRPPNTFGITSGSPFYLALEEKVVLPKNFVEFGIQEHCNDKSFYNYIKQKKITVLTLDQIHSQKAGAAGLFFKILKQFSKKKLKIVVSFDVDSIQMVPGVSSPQSDGLSVSEFLSLAHLCGKCPNVVSVGFFELAPFLDTNQQTTRIVATAIHRFLSGITSRSLNGSR